MPFVSKIQKLVNQLHPLRLRSYFAGLCVDLHSYKGWSTLDQANPQAGLRDSIKLSVIVILLCLMGCTDLRGSRAKDLHALVIRCVHRY